MLLQVRTDNHIENTEALQETVRAEVEGSLTPHYSDRLRRVEIYLQDTNSHKGGIDKRCTIEAHPAGHATVVAHAQAATIDEAVSGAADKLLRALDHTLGRLNDRGGSVSMSGQES